MEEDNQPEVFDAMATLGNSDKSSNSSRKDTHRDLVNGQSGVADVEIISPSLKDERLSGGFCQRIFPTSFWEEFKGTLSLAWALVVAQWCQISMQPVSTMFGGHLGKVQLDAIALANSIINVMGYSVIMGMSTACDTLFAQTFGSTNKRGLGLQLQRSLVILFLSLFPCYSLHLNAENILIGIGQDREVSKLVARYLLVFTPGLVLVYLMVVLRKYIQCQNIVTPSIVIGVIGAAANALCQYLLIYVAGMGLDGSAIGQVIAYGTQVLLLVVYILATKMYKPTWQGWDLRLFEQWGSFLKLAVFGMLMTCLEWWAFEMCTFLAGTLGTTELGAQSVVFNVDLLFYGIPSGMATATSIRVGQFLGARMPNHAKTSTRVGMSILACASLVVVTLFATLRYELPKLFTNDQDVIDLSAKLLLVSTVYVFFDNIATTARGVIRGCGKQVLGTIIVFIGYYCIALPLGISLMLLTPLRSIGLWIGLSAALSVTGIVFFIYCTFLIDWEKESELAQIRTGARRAMSEQSKELGENQPHEKTPLLKVKDDARGHGEEQLSASNQPYRLSSSLLLKRIVTIILFILPLVVGLLCRLYIAVPLAEESSRDNVTTLIPISDSYELLAYSGATTFQE